MPASRPVEARVDFTFTATQTKELLQQAKAFPDNLARNVRREIREAGKVVVRKMQSQVQGGSFATDTGMRAAIAAGIKMQLNTSDRRPGIRIIASASKLPADKKPMAKAFEKAAFRHPLFANTDVWVTQPGRPYFNKTVKGSRDDLTRAVNKALEDAAQEMARDVR